MPEKNGITWEILAKTLDAGQLLLAIGGTIQLERIEASQTMASYQRLWRQSLANCEAGSMQAKWGSSYTSAKLGGRPETSGLRGFLDHLSSHMVAHSA